MPVLSISRTRPTRAAAAGAAGLLGVALLAATPSAAGASVAASPAGNAYTQTNLVSDVPGAAALTDPNLVNAWGLSQGPTTPVWVSSNGGDVSTLYSDAKHVVTQVPLVVSIPGGAPTGQVFNGGLASFLLSNGQPARFIFAAESGSISAWNPALTPITSAVTVATTPDAVYKGLALATTRDGQRLLAANFHSGRVDVFDETFAAVPQPAWAFRDSRLPSDYAPFNLAVIGGRVFVTFAQQSADRVDDVPGAGHGFVDVFDVHGHLMSRFASRGVLDSPWGLTVAPQGFGAFSGDVLVGNFGDGLIHAFDPMTGRGQGVLRDASGNPLWIDGLWALMPGNGTSASKHDVWFSAGPAGESHGLLGLISAQG